MAAVPPQPRLSPVASPTAGGYSSQWRSDDSSSDDIVKYGDAVTPERQTSREHQNQQRQSQPVRDSQPQRPGVSAKIRNWTAPILLLCYLVFSVAMYTILNREATKVFWFLYLAVATIVAFITALEAYDGLTPLREARKAVQKIDHEGLKFKTTDQELPSLELVFDLADGDEARNLQHLASLKRLRRSLLYPPHKVRIHLLCCANGALHSMAADFDESLEHAGIQIHALPLELGPSSSTAVRTSALLSTVPLSNTSIVALFNGAQRPHPHAVRHAAETLSQNPQIDILQGRTILMPPTPRASFPSALATLQTDLQQALLLPGRSVTWGLAIANSTNAYWRADVLRSTVAAAPPSTAENALDLGHIAASQRARTVHDLRITAYEPTPASFKASMLASVSHAREGIFAAVRYFKLIFSRNPQTPPSASRPGTAEKVPAQPGATAAQNWTLKTRFGAFYSLILLRVASHAVVQYFSLALGIAISSLPKSTAEFARAIFWPYPISIWLVVAGLVCLAATVGMLYKARSEFVPLWTAPVVVVLYPLLLFFGALVDVYGFLDAIVR